MSLPIDSKKSRQVNHEDVKVDVWMGPIGDEKKYEVNMNKSLGCKDHDHWDGRDEGGTYYIH